MPLVYRFLVAALLQFSVLPLGAGTDGFDEVCDATTGACGLPNATKYLFAAFEYRNGLGDQRYLWFQTVLKLARQLGRTLVLPKFYVPDSEFGDQYRNAHFEPFTSLYDPSAFRSFNDWISYEDFRSQTQAKLKTVFLTPQTAKSYHKQECEHGGMIRRPGTVSFFGDDWKVSKFKCLDQFEMAQPLQDSSVQVLGLTTRSNSELPNYQAAKKKPAECNRDKWIFDMAYNETLVAVADQYIQDTFGSDPFVAIHWRHGSSMHVEADHLAGSVKGLIEKETILPKKVFLATNCQKNDEIEKLEKLVGLPLVRFDKQAAKVTTWQHALIDQIVSSRANAWLASSYSSTYAKCIAFHRFKTGMPLEDVEIHCN